MKGLMNIFVRLRLCLATTNTSDASSSVLLPHQYLVNTKTRETPCLHRSYDTVIVQPQQMSSA